MKQFHFKFTFGPMVVALLLGIGQTNWAHAQGSENGGGGSVCEVKFNEIRIKLINWIRQGNGRELDLSSVTYDYKNSKDRAEIYQSKMLQAMTGKNFHLSCEDGLTKGQRELVMTHRLKLKDIPNFAPTPVSVNGRSVTCINWLDYKSGKLQIKCDAAQFYNAKADEQFTIVHHEFASKENIGIERHPKTFSDYQVSSQIPHFLSVVVSVEMINRVGSVIKAKFANAHEMERLAIQEVFESFQANFDDLDGLFTKYGEAHDSEYAILKVERMKKIRLKLDRLTQKQLIDGISADLSFVVTQKKFAEPTWFEALGGSKGVFSVSFYDQQTLKRVFEFQFEEIEESIGRHPGMVFKNDYQLKGFRYF